MKKIVGLNGNSNSDMEELAMKTNDGDFAELATIMNDFFLYVSDHLPRLDKYDKAVWWLVLFCPPSFGLVNCGIAPVHFLVPL